MVEHRLVVVFAGDNDELVPRAGVDDPLVCRSGCGSARRRRRGGCRRCCTCGVRRHKKVDETLLPRLSKLPGFGGYQLIKGGDGVITSVGFFDTSAPADESTKLASAWVRELVKA